VVDLYHEGVVARIPSGEPQRAAEQAVLRLLTD
jgi:hypothetical protein